MGGGGALEGREEVLDEEGVRELVETELALVAVLGGAGGHGHDAGLHMRTSSRRDWERKVWQAEWTEAREVWSRACTHTSDWRGFATDIMQELMLLLSKRDGFWCHSRQVAEQIPLVFVLVIEIRRLLVAISKVVTNKYDKDSCVSTVVSSSAWAKYKAFDIQLGSTHAAVAPKISALRAFVSKPTTRANSDVKSTISPTLT